MTMTRTAGVACALALTVVTLALTGCPEEQLKSFAADGVLSATIRRTDYGVPHIQADNLESLAFGIGYAFSQDNACMLLDLVARYNSRRSRFYGPDQVPGSGDSANLISDFSYLALEIRQQAIDGYEGLTDNTKAMLSGYSKGFNQYLQDTGSENLDPHCAGQPWVQPITELDMLTALLGTALLPGAGQFLAPIFLATPPNTSYAPSPLARNLQNGSAQPQLALRTPQPTLPIQAGAGLASNAWAIGKDLSANHRGMLLGNPHFPHTGLLRLWQFHSTIPGVLNVMGASLQGTPGVVNIGFNENLAWSHTFSSAEHFIMYKLTLDPADATGMTYIVDGQPRTIQEKALQLDVAVAPGTVVPFTKKVYYSDYGPMVVVPESLPWGDDSQGQFVAYSLKDANRKNFDIVDHWLALNMARNMKQFKQAFMDYDGVIFNNTIATDRDGNTFYIDDSTVPDLSPAAEAALRTLPPLIQARQQAGFTILPGADSSFDFSGPVPYARAPKLERSDFVQNSNDSYWLTNPTAPLTGYSTLYGKIEYPQSPRSRMGQRLLADSAGPDQRFDMDEVEAALLSARSYLAEELLPELLELCQQQGTQPLDVVLEDASTVAVNLAPACQQLAAWDGHFYLQSRGAQIFREFAQQFANDPQYLIPFDVNNPLNTPTTLDANATVLQQLGRAVRVLQQAGVALDATLGEVQFVELSDVAGNPETRLPWEGGNSIEGGFNVFHSNANDYSLIPRVQYPHIAGSQISAEAHGYHLDYGSSWMMLVNFTAKGVKARGLLTYSQSIDPRSPHRADQTLLYSQQPRLRPLYFSEREIVDHTQSEITVQYTAP